MTSYAASLDLHPRPLGEGEGEGSSVRVTGRRTTYPHPGPLPARLCRNAQIVHIVISSVSERSCIFSHVQTQDFSPPAPNDNCDTVSAGEEEEKTRLL